MRIRIQSPCSASIIVQYGIKNWPIWECQPSEFSWQYDEKEICLIIEGEANIITNEESYHIKSGDLVEFPKGMSCQWHVIRSIKKHFRLGE